MRFVATGGLVPIRCGILMAALEGDALLGLDTMLVTFAIENSSRRSRSTSTGFVGLKSKPARSFVSRMSLRSVRRAGRSGVRRLGRQGPAQPGGS